MLNVTLYWCMHAIGWQFHTASYSDISARCMCAGSHTPLRLICSSFQDSAHISSAHGRLIQAQKWVSVINIWFAFLDYAYSQYPIWPGNNPWATIATMPTQLRFFKLWQYPKQQCIRQWGCVWNLTDFRQLTTQHNTIYRPFCLGW